ncbi:MAG: dockerin type I repeat-containing protein [Ruminococcus sp.]|nr:dockerin type I repeat-containing protein [Ruminococcus sp.]
MKKKIISAVAAALSVMLVSAVVVSTASYAGAAETYDSSVSATDQYGNEYIETYPYTFQQAPTFPPEPEQPFSYTVKSDGTAAITDYTGRGGHVVIPERIDGHLVTEIRDYAISYFVPCGTMMLEWEMTYGEPYPIDEIYSVTIPPTVTQMDYEAVGFYQDGVEMRFHKIEDFTIYGKKYSRAYFYAIDNGFNFVETEDDQGSTNHCTEQDPQPYSYPDNQGSTNHCTEQDSQPYSYPDNQGSTNHCTEQDPQPYSYPDNQGSTNHCTEQDSQPYSYPDNQGSTNHCTELDSQPYSYPDNQGSTNHCTEQDSQPYSYPDNQGSTNHCTEQDPQPYSYPDYPIATTGVSPVGVLGDVDSDGVLTISDATMIQFRLAYFVTFTQAQEKLADYDGDKTVSIKDVTKIQYKLAGLE